MKPVLSNVMAALVALHSVLGCCWHHDHACAAENADSVAVAGAEHRHVDDHDGHHRNASGRVSDGCDADHHDSASAGSEGNGQNDTQPACDGHQKQGRKQCQGGTCVFLSPSKSTTHASLAPVGLPPAVALIDDSLGIGSGLPSFSFAGEALSPPLRLHLIHCVILV